jgi:hypothetical protein
LGDEPTFMNFQCEPEGNVSFILGKHMFW